MAQVYDAWGIDLLLSDNDLLFKSGDFVTISSINNVAQAIKNRILTERGSLGYNPTYGLGLEGLIGEKITPARMAFIQTSIQETLLQDPRISSLKVLSVKPRANVIGVVDIFARVQIINSTETVDLNLTYPFFTPEPTANLINNEVQTSLSLTTVQTEYPVFKLSGIFLATDTSKTNDLSSNATISGKIITLSARLPSESTQLIIDYYTLSTTRTSTLADLRSNEQALSLTNTTVQVAFPIYNVVGVFLFSDISKTGTNYYLNGSFNTNEKVITLGTPLPDPQTLVRVDYVQLKQILGRV